MEQFTEIIRLFLYWYGFLVIGIYALPVGLVYYLFFIRNRERWKDKRIQKKFPPQKQIRREVIWSLSAMAIFAVGGTLVTLLVQAGHSRMYLDFREFGPLYFLFSILLSLLFHDTFIYWVHRFMHWKKVFKYVHLAHHKSVNPTPWSIFQFQPIEAILQVIPFCLLPFLFPIHPIAILIVLYFNDLVNIMGHTGFELAKPQKKGNWFYRMTSKVSHHDFHHTHVRYNFGVYFTFWDRLMGTFHEGNFLKREDS